RNRDQPRRDVARRRPRRSPPGAAARRGRDGPHRSHEGQAGARPRLRAGARTAQEIEFEDRAGGPGRRSRTQAEALMMGTSTNYDAPPSWGPLKSQVTRLAGESAPPP